MPYIVIIHQRRCARLHGFACNCGAVDYPQVDVISEIPSSWVQTQPGLYADQSSEWKLSNRELVQVN